MVAEKTGYPIDVLDLSMSLEADLGIDSSKRVEIFLSLREQAIPLPEVDASRMAKLTTLGQFRNYLVDAGKNPSAE